jgi:tetratricopeptide (TPR) repeat protein
MRLRAGILAIGLALAMAGSAVAAGQAAAPSPEAAYDEGMAAYRAGAFERAIPALELAAAKNHFFARFYLARIYASSATAYVDHAKAYMLFRGLGDQFADIDPDDDPRAPFVAKALTALATYVKHGVLEIRLAPDPERAAEYLKHAATFFNDEDAQFELAKLYLSGEGIAPDAAQALHYLSVLTTERKHPGAQAFLADLYWRGGPVKRDPLTALALIAVAVENAPESERVWIDDIYQNIFCGASEAVRHQAENKVIEWRVKYRRVAGKSDRAAMEASRGARTCADDQPVMPVERRMTSPIEGVTAAAAVPAPERQAIPAPERQALQGNVIGGIALKDAGVATTEPAR